MTPTPVLRALSAASAPPRSLRILVVDDQPAVREGLARLIRGAWAPLPDVRTAASIAEVLYELSVARPDLVLLDVDLAGDDGLAVLPHLLPGCLVMVLTSHGDAGTRERASVMGAHVFLEKTAPASVLLAQFELLARSVPPVCGGT